MRMSHFELIRGAQSEDLAVGIEATLRLKRSTERLTWTLIVIAAIGVIPVGIEIYHLILT